MNGFCPGRMIRTDQWIEISKKLFQKGLTNPKRFAIILIQTGKECDAKWQKLPRF
jgi:hypothetical protein